MHTQHLRDMAGYVRAYAGASMRIHGYAAKTCPAAWRLQAHLPSYVGPGRAGGGPLCLLWTHTIGLMLLI